MKPINTSIFDFPTLIAKGCVYVDKTAQIYELAKPSADGVNYNPAADVRTIDDVKCERAE